MKHFQFEPHWCKHCGNLLVRGPKEDRCKFVKRKYCNRNCANQKNAIIPNIKWCAYSGCGKLLVQMPGEVPSKFAQRKYCDAKCRSASRGRCRICDILTTVQPCILCQNDDLIRRQRWTGETANEMLMLIKRVMRSGSKPHNGEEGRTWLDDWLDGKLDRYAGKKIEIA